MMNVINLLWPVAIAQGLWLKHRVPRLPEALGPTTGIVGSTKPIQLALYGESPVAGVGVDRHADGLGPATATGIAAAKECAVQWRVVGRNGLLSQDLPELIASDLIDNPPPKFAVICMGVNDAKGFTPIEQWREHIRSSKSLLHGCGVSRLLITDVPALDQFPALPRPLSLLLGRRAERMNQALRTDIHARELNVSFEPVFDAALFARDGFHPSARGFERWGSALSAALLSPEAG